MQTTFVIKKGIPVKRARSFYPFEQMEIGDCFDADDDMGCVGGYVSKSSRAHSIRASARSYAQRANVDFKIQACVLFENGKRIVRVWRVA